MKKLLIAVALMTAFAAHSENWEPVSDDVDGATRMLLDVDSVAPGVSIDGYALISADFKFVEKDSQTPVSYLISPKSCINGGGKMIARALDDKEWKTVAIYQWSSDGEHLYDYAGMAMCVVAKAKMDAANPPKDPVNKKQKMIPQGSMI